MLAQNGFMGWSKPKDRRRGLQIREAKPQAHPVVAG